MRPILTLATLSFASVFLSFHLLLTGTTSQVLLPCRSSSCWLLAIAVPFWSLESFGSGQGQWETGELPRGAGFKGKGTAGTGGSHCQPGEGRAGPGEWESADVWPQPCRSQWAGAWQGLTVPLGLSLGWTGVPTADWAAQLLTGTRGRSNWTGNRGIYS